MSSKTVAVRTGSNSFRTRTEPNKPVLAVLVPAPAPVRGSPPLTRRGSRFGRRPQRTEPNFGKLPLLPFPPLPPSDRLGSLSRKVPDGMHGNTGGLEPVFS